jgi:hypothetical protein
MVWTRPDLVAQIPQGRRDRYAGTHFATRRRLIERPLLAEPDFA